MSQTTESSSDLLPSMYSATRCHDDSSDNSDGYTIVRNSNESSSTEDEEDDSEEYETSDEDQSEESSSHVSKENADEEETEDDEADQFGFDSLDVDQLVAVADAVESRFNSKQAVVSSHVSREDSSEEETDDIDEVNAKSEDTGYLDFLIEAYDSLLSRYDSKQAVAMASRVAVRRIYQGSLIQEAVRLVGEEAVRKLTIIGSLQGTNTKKIDKTIQVSCNGEAVKGNKTIQQLVESNIISKRGSKYDSSNKKIHLNLIAATMPHAAFQDMDNDDKTTKITRRKSRHGVETTLPLQLQYLEAGSLPLGTKTRKAHLHWSSQFLKSINCKFNPTIYKRNMKQAVVYENMEWLTKKLNAIESSLTLNAKEEEINVKQFFKKYYAIAQKARTKAAKQNEVRTKKATRAERRRRRRNATNTN